MNGFSINTTECLASMFNEKMIVTHCDVRVRGDDGLCGGEDG